MIRRRKVGAVGQRLWHADLVLDVVLSEQWAAGGDLTDEWKTAHVGLSRIRRPAPIHELDRPRLRRIALEHAGSLELREVCVDRRGRPQADGLADLSDGGRIAVLVDVLVQVLEDRALLGRTASCREHVFDHGSQGFGRRQEEVWYRTN